MIDFPQNTSYHLEQTAATPCLNTEVSVQNIKEQYKVILYYSPNCPFCKKVFAKLAEMKKTIPLKNTQTQANSNDLIKIGGKKQVPCLVINGKPLYESNDIIHWLKTHQNQY